MLISAVIPCYNEESVVETTISRVSASLVLVNDAEVEILIVDDGSTDQTVSLAQKVSLPPRVSLRIIKFSRNFGHQAAVSAGIEKSSGDVIAILDADLQDPPELLPEMIDRLHAGGFDVVYGKRVSRSGISRWKKIAYYLFYRGLRMLVSDIDIPAQVGDFRVISRRMADTLISMPERGRFLRGMIPYVGFSQNAFEYEREARFSGNPKYTVSKLLHLAMDGLISFSTRPLRVALYFGLLLFVLSVIGVLTVLGIRLGTEQWPPGWATTMIVLLSFGGLQFLFLGLLGEYIGRILQEVKGRPNYIIDE